ncbi:GNAT family N-acetyltransferase [Chitinophaga deserti]|uniref:GNAT family N-acetyltransferase n=1 Tax=Chitinophaga deserti TaxID=2164099 RepID=UPI000D6B2264|nr:GNAT family N-acetyltransferase [Chitinophaga deserti]
MDLTGFTLRKVNPEYSLKPFDCGDQDLNEFLTQKAIHYRKELLAVTYILENEDRTIAFFSIFNDSVRVQEKDFASKSAFKKFLRQLLTYPKRHLEYIPAIKIGRLGVCSQTQKSGIGKTIIDFIIAIALKLNDECACKFVTVDAYAQSLGFYERRGFKYFSENDAGKDTRQMFLDLTLYSNAVESS